MTFLDPDHPHRRLPSSPIVAPYASTSPFDQATPFGHRRASLPEEPHSPYLRRDSPASRRRPRPLEPPPPPPQRSFWRRLIVALSGTAGVVLTTHLVARRCAASLDRFSPSLKWVPAVLAGGAVGWMNFSVFRDRGVDRFNAVVSRWTEASQLIVSLTQVLAADAGGMGSRHPLAMNLALIHAATTAASGAGRGAGTGGGRNSVRRQRGRPARGGGRQGGRAMLRRVVEEISGNGCGRHNGSGDGSDKDAVGSDHIVEEPPAALPPPTSSSSSSSSWPPSSWTSSERRGILVEAERYMRYASATYGIALLTAMDLERPSTWREADLMNLRNASNSTPLSLRTDDIKHVMADPDRAAVCYHCDVRTEDVLLDELHGENPECPRHAVILDREGKQVVVAIRGTRSLSDAVVHDLVCIAVPFLNGMAHKGMARAALAVIASVREVVNKALCDNKGFGVVLTGHSMGAGTAALATMLLLEGCSTMGSTMSSTMRGAMGGRRQSIYGSLLPPNTPVRCFAFAPPPVFAPFEAAPQGTRDAILAFKHGDDVFANSSLLSLRALLITCRIVDDLPLSFRERMRIATGRRHVLPGWNHCLMLAVNGHASCLSELIAEEEDVLDDEAPLLVVPSSTLVWLRRADGSGGGNGGSGGGGGGGGGGGSGGSGGRGRRYHASVIDATEFAEGGITLSSHMLVDHFNNRYEWALRCLLREATATSTAGFASPTGLR